MTLESVQGFLAGAFRRQEPVEGDAELAPRCAEHVSGSARLTPARQVDIYRRQFWLRHVDSLREDYPGLAHVLDHDTDADDCGHEHDGVFERFCRAYLEAHPPRTKALRDLGADILTFAAGWDGFPADRRELALEMLRYEHAFVDLFDGPDVAPLDLAKLAALPPDAMETARFVLHPLLVLLELAFPVHRLRYAVRGGESPPLPERAATPIRLVLFRSLQNEISFEELDPRAHAMLAALAAGEPLVAAMSGVAATLDEAAAADLAGKVGGWFQSWASWGLFVDVVQ